MKTKLITLAALAVAFAAGVHTENRRTEETRNQLRLATSQLERFENPYVFTHAQFVARITGRPLYQVLTGKLLHQEAAFHEN